MGTDYVVFYTEASLFCIVILLMLLINDRIYSTQQEKQLCFNRAVTGFILYFVSDACWAAVLGGVLPRVRTLVELFNLTNHVLLSYVAYEWFMFMAASEKMPFRNDRRRRRLCLLPMVVSIAAMLVAYIAKPTFWINESGELNDWYYPMLIAAPAFYLITAFVFSVINARKAESRDETKQYWLIGIFPLGVMGFGMLQVFTLNAPTFCFGCTVMLLFFYIQNMQTMISVDALTRLNNRGQINRYLEQVRYRENAHVFVMMIDIDRFKEINDTYGHAEGDRALILASEALKQTGEHIKSPVFLGRYGGDEFMLILQNPGEGEQPADVTQALRDAMAQKRQENRLRYALEISVGYDELRDKSDTMEACVNRADEKLYEEKRAKGTLR